MFDNHFEAFLADTEPGRQTHFRLRYQVYGLDTGWEDPSLFPDEMERDELDDSSVAFLARRNRTRGWIATMRLIFRPVEELPVWRHVRMPAGRLPSSARFRTMEFSRLCVVTKYRRRGQPRADAPPLPTPESDDSFLNAGYRASESWIFLGLIRAGLVYSLEHGVDQWIFLVADSLARLIRRSGLDIEPVGDEIEHRGMRRPYLLDLRTGIRDMPARAPEVHEMFSHRPAYRLFSELSGTAQGVREGPRRGGRWRDGSTSYAAAPVGLDTAP